MLSRYRGGPFERARPLAEAGVQDKMNNALHLRCAWKALRDAGIAEQEQNKIKDAYYAQEKVLKQSVGTAVEAEVKNYRLKVPGNRQYILGSAPEFSLEGEPVLALVKTVVEALGFTNVAGDARDQFHTRVMTRQEMDSQLKGWRLAWKGKCQTAIGMTAKRYPDIPIVIITFQGGDECRWELNEIDTSIIPYFAHVKIERRHYITWQEGLKEMCDFDIDIPVPPALPAATSGSPLDHGMAHTPPVAASSQPTPPVPPALPESNVSQVELSFTHSIFATTLDHGVAHTPPLAASSQPKRCCAGILESKKSRCVAGSVCAMLLFSAIGAGGYFLSATTTTTTTTPWSPFYRKLKYGAEGCPEGMEIADERECERAIRSLGIDPNPEWVENDPRRPPRCSLVEPSYYYNMYYNYAKSGTGSPHMAPICKKDPSRLAESVSVPFM